LSGNFDREGGLMFGNPVAWGANTLPNPAWDEGVYYGRWHSRVRGTPEVLGQVPVSCMAEEIATPGEGQLHALVTIAGNPVISSPDAGRLDDALPMLDCMISIDNYLNETTRHAHVILPGLSAFEQPHFDDLIPMWAMRSAGNYSPAIFPPPAVQGLGQIGGFKLYVEDRSDAGLDALYGATQNLIGQAWQTPGLTGLFSSYTINTPQLEADGVSLALLPQLTVGDLVDLGVPRAPAIVIAREAKTRLGGG